jgi:glycosyltransferase involved in cell wall biosynthesis
MAPQKRPLLFLQKAEEIYRALPNARFVWVGDGILSAEWDERVRARGLEKVISRLPWAHDIPPFLHAADVFMHVAQFEGLPLALLEAMSAALPCLMTSNLCQEMPFLQNGEPLLLDSSANLAPMLSNRPDLRRRGIAGRRLIEREFSFERMAESYEMLYKAISSPSTAQ